jgi:16S rRNA (uracil1498-N3)-methyltransferase
MRLHRFYSSEKVGPRTQLAIVDADLIHQVRRVFRLMPNDKVVLFDGSGSEYICTIVSYDGDDGMTLTVSESVTARFTPSLGSRLWLFAALVKKDTFETIVEKATELGVTDIVPILAERSEKKSANDVRLAKIIMEASEQSGRGDLPTLHPVMSLKECLDLCDSEKLRVPLVFHTDGTQLEKGTDSPGALTQAVLIGPEGGWSPHEVSLFHEKKIAIRCLGPQVLRAETAVVAALSQVVFR